MVDPAPPLSDLMRRWLAGWVVSRGLRAAEEVRGGLRIRLGSPNPRPEIIALADDPAVLGAVAAELAATREPAGLTVAASAPAPVAAIARAAGLAVRDEHEWLMTVDPRRHPRQPARPPYAAATARTGAVLEAVVRHPADGVVARGTVVVSGGDAIVDSVETVPAHRRRGLGGVIMGALAEHAVAAGATTGILLASPDGHRLYSALGWTTHATVILATNRREHGSQGL